MRRLDLTGNVYGRLTVLRREHATGKRSFWVVQCSCGVTKSVNQDSLRRGTSRSCGCLRREVVSAAFTKHGLSHIKIYMTWYDMVARCHNPKDTGYRHYGGCGITVCPAWRDSFEVFLDDMGSSWLEGLTLDRINVLAGYHPTNCRWATPLEQARNVKRKVTNTSGVVGVCLHKGNYYASWVTTSGAQKTKSFSIRKYGEELAFFAACEVRDIELTRLNNAGAGYGTQHFPNINKLYEDM